MYTLNWKIENHAITKTKENSNVIAWGEKEEKEHTFQLHQVYS